jgi:hypothetical protein
MSSLSASSTAATPGPVHAEASVDAQGSHSLAGWYESSWELVSGLEVSEVLEPEAWRSTESGELLSARA